MSKTTWQAKIFWFSVRKSQLVRSFLGVSKCSYFSPPRKKLSCLNGTEMVRTEKNRHKKSKSKVIYTQQAGCVSSGVLEEWGSMETPDSSFAPWENDEEKFGS